MFFKKKEDKMIKGIQAVVGKADHVVKVRFEYGNKRYEFDPMRRIEELCAAAQRQSECYRSLSGDYSGGLNDVGAYEPSFDESAPAGEVDDRRKRILENWEGILDQISSIQLVVKLIKAGILKEPEGLLEPVLEETVFEQNFFADPPFVLRGDTYSVRPFLLPEPQ